MSTFLSSVTLMSYGLFALASYVIPGPDWAVIVPRALDNRRAGLLTAAGVQSGLLVHGSLAALGLGTIITQSPRLIVLLQIAGGLYLMYLGGSDIAGATTRTDATPGVGSAPTATQNSGWVDYKRGLLVNVLNPKVALFFVAVLPQFLPAEPALAFQVAVLLVALDIAIGMGVWGALVVTAAFASKRLKSRGLNIWSTRVMGAVLFTFGAAFILNALAR